MLLPPTNNCVIEESEIGKAGERTTSWSENPDFSVFPASLNPDRLIGSVNPGYGGGLVGRHYPAD